jgi:hypothetical protein
MHSLAKPPLDDLAPITELNSPITELNYRGSRSVPAEEPRVYWGTAPPHGLQYRPTGLKLTEAPDPRFATTRAHTRRVSIGGVKVAVIVHPKTMLIGKPTGGDWEAERPRYVAMRIAEGTRGFAIVHWPDMKVLRAPLTRDQAEFGRDVWNSV